MTFAGVIPILPTPFHDDETLDLDSWRRLLEFMIGLGVDGVTILGVLGESNRLNDHERERLIETAVETVRQRVPIIVGASHTGTHAATYLSRRAQDLGANAVMVTPAKEAVPNDDRILELYRRIGEEISIPIVLQDHPTSSDVHQSVDLILRVLRQVPSVACVKEEAVPTAGKIRRLREASADRRIPILTGLGALYAPFELEAGSDGFNTGFAFPEILQEMVAAARHSDWQRVHDIYSRFAALIVFEQQPGLAIRKELFRRRGLLKSARVRHPGATASPPQSRQLDALLARTLADADITRPIASDNVLSSRHSEGTTRAAARLAQPH
jgi:4-hydroxy-tetrahydrodipicolinate synthase